MTAPTFKALLPIRIVSVANLREQWFVRHRRSKSQRHTADLCCRSAKIIPLPMVVTLTRLMGKSQRPFDSDNLASAFKAVRDGVADALGHADNHPQIEWRYAQAKGAQSCAHVEIVGL